MPESSNKIALLMLPASDRLRCVSIYYDRNFRINKLAIGAGQNE